MAVSMFSGYLVSVDPEARKLSKEIEDSRQDIEKLQERVRQLVARRGKRAELVKSTHAMTGPDIPDKPAMLRPSTAASAEEQQIELSVEEGLQALQKTPMSEIRLIAFKHGAIVLLFSDERAMTVRMDERGPKPVLDLLTNNEAIFKKAGLPPSVDQRPRA